ncbi:HD domain-containing protein [Clostridium peptidivorans]|uniref:HD domain-containing protein n=1 Tax=Clostridium peptidivorans TaxID=100174 RepID=UPI001FA8BC88|nr:HD domain-containing protein [Clostridium peptidivorans]
MNVADRINAILQNENYKIYLAKNEEIEKNREFCHHDLQHFLDVARIAYIINLEKNINIGKDMVYAAALLHDIGRWMQYEKGVPHDEASAKLAADILKVCGFNENEIKEIVAAILMHRKVSVDEESLSYLIYRSDKLSRGCFNCKAILECNWPEEKKNYNIKY